MIHIDTLNGGNVVVTLPESGETPSERATTLVTYWDPDYNEGEGRSWTQEFSADSEGNLDLRDLEDEAAAPRSAGAPTTRAGEGVGENTIIIRIDGGTDVTSISCRSSSGISMLQSTEYISFPEVTSLPADVLEDFTSLIEAHFPKVTTAYEGVYSVFRSDNLVYLELTSLPSGTIAGSEEGDWTYDLKLKGIPVIEQGGTTKTLCLALKYVYDNEAEDIFDSIVIQGFNDNNYYAEGYYRQAEFHNVVDTFAVEVGDYASNLDGITSISCANVTSVGAGAFSNCTSLTSVNLPAVTNIGNYAFAGCPSLTSVTIPNNATIGGAAFVGCGGLADNDGFIVFRDVLYGYCGYETEVEIPTGVTEISNEAFCYMTSIQSITVPNSVQSIGAFAFAGCPSLDDIYVPFSTANLDELGASGWGVGVDGEDSYHNVTLHCTDGNIVIVNGVLPQP